MASACISRKTAGKIREKRRMAESPEDEEKSVLDDFTSSSSLLEFLSHEQKQKCLEELLEGSNSDVDIDSIFEEINRLSDNSDERSVDEILKEAEMLMHLTSQSLSESGKRETPRKSTPEASGKDGDELQDASVKLVEGGCGVGDMDKVVPRDSLVKFDEIEVEAQQVKNRESSPTAEETTTPEIAKEIEEEEESLVENTRDKCIGTDIEFLDKFTAFSPQRVVTPTKEEHWPPRQRALEDEITDLQEKLKDTEERFHSLRLQYDTVSSHHRSLRESCASSQEETERLRLEVQHLTECTSVLRTEVQASRNDRAEAQEVQKVLQSELEESRSEKRKLQEQTDKDSKVILDLQRQCKEMERILMRKHPDSVSALIVASKGAPNSKEEASTRRLLEQRITQLETDARQQDTKAQKILANVQAKFSTVQSKYETHIADLETQVLSLQEINTKLTQKVESQSAIIRERNSIVMSSSLTQTEEFPERDVTVVKVSMATQTEQKPTQGKPSSANGKKSTTNPRIVNSYSESQIHHGNDPHLMATIRGMRVDLAIKEKALQRLTRELDECKKTIRKTQQQKERELFSAPAASRTMTKKTSDVDVSNDATTMSLKEAQSKIKLLELDYKSLHDKRLQDLRTLQAAHEKELASCHETVSILQQRVKERDEAFALQKRRRVPVDYYALKAKVTSLERRHLEREQKLHMLVDALSKGRLVNGQLLEDALTSADCSRCHHHHLNDN